MLFRSIIVSQDKYFNIREKRERERERERERLWKKRKLNSSDWGERSEPSGSLELGTGPACYHLIYQGVTIQGQKIVSIPPPKRG